MIIYGTHAVESALLSSKKQTIKVLYIEKGAKHLDFIPEYIKKKVQIVNPEEMQKITGKFAIHQGIAADIELNIFRNIEDLKNCDDNCAIAILDSVTDPHNVGAVIRSAACFNIHGIVIAENNACKITAVTAKTASGALEHVFIYKSKNLAQTIEKLKLFGFWIISLSEKGTSYLHDVDLKGKIALILGSEGRGIRKLQLENSDFIAKLPTSPAFGTLNISSAAAITFYETHRQNHQ